MSKLVQIEDMRHPEAALRRHDFTNYPAKGYRTLTALQIANRRRPKELLALVDALTEMFRRIGMAEVCRSCWAGELDEKRSIYVSVRKDRGCCGSCPLVGHKACLAKPTGCALYMCSTTQTKFWDTYQFLHLIRDLLYKGTSAKYNVTGVYASGVYTESRVRLDRSEKRLLHALTHAVNAWEEAA